MPQAIAAGIISAAGVAGTAAATAITIATYAVTAAVSLAFSNSQKQKAERAARNQYEASVVDRMVNVQSAVAPRDLVLGRVRKGGAAVFQTSIAPHNAVFVSVLALAGHEIDGVERVYFNETPVDIDADGNVTTAPWGQTNRRSEKDTSAQPVRTLVAPPVPGTLTVFETQQYGSPESAVVNPGAVVEYTLVGTTLTITNYDPSKFYTVNYQWEQFLSSARVYVHLGSPDQTADARMQLLLPGVWTASHRARGVAYLECEFVYSDTAFPTGLPNVTAQIRGAKCFDPRSGLTQFTVNPAIMQRHVLTHPQFGKRASLTSTEEARIMVAANSCDLGISYTGSDWVPMYRASMVVPFGAAPRDVLDDLAQAMGGEWAYLAGEFHCRAGVYQAPLMNLTDADLAVVRRSSDGGVSQVPIGISTHRPRADKINSVAARIWDESANFLETPLTPYRSEVLIAEDGAELTQEVTMPAVFYAGQAFHICGIMLRDGRDPLTVTLPFKMRAYPLELFDGVTLTLSRYGWVNKEFRILNRTFAPDGQVVLTLKETSVAIYQFGAPFRPEGSASNSGLPKPWEIYPPVITSISSGEGELVVQSDGTIVNSVRVSWSPIEEASILQGGTVEVEFQVLPNGAWRSVSVPGTATEARLIGVNDLAVILIRARTRNLLAVSVWGLQKTHQVIGKTEPPPNMEQLAISGSVLTWTLPRRVPDLAGFVFRFQYGSSLDWNSAAPLHSGLITESPYDLVTRPGGVVTIMGKAQDTSGNQSVATANVVMNLGDPPIANVLEEWDFDALGWPYAAGESSGWTIVAGDPTANALDSFYGTDDQSFYRGEAEPFYGLGSFDQMIYVTPEISVNSALAGSVLTVRAQSQGIDLRIEYRLAGPSPFYGPDTASFYGDDSMPFYERAGAWTPWPGQIVAKRDAYQFRVIIGASSTQGVLQGLVVTIDAPDMQQLLPDVAIAAGGTVIPFTKPFTSIKVVNATLQANGSGAETVRIDKSNPMAPVIRAYNAAGIAVAGATADIVIQGY